MKKLLPFLCIILLTFFSTAALAIPNGSSILDAGVSAKQILNDGFSIGDGLYWIDPDGPGGNDAFEIYADMTTDADEGGWTLGVHSAYGSGSATTDMVSNTGIVESTLTTGHTRNLSLLAIDNIAQIRHVIKDIDGKTLLDGYYTSGYHDTMGAEGEWTIFDGNTDVLSYHLGRPWTSRENDNDTYGGGN